jgi:hypothetical protein
VIEHEETAVCLFEGSDYVPEAKEHCHAARSVRQAGVYEQMKLLSDAASFDFQTLH